VGREKRGLVFIEYKLPAILFIGHFLKIHFEALSLTVTVFGDGDFGK
jgi:hypothetical protein